MITRGFAVAAVFAFGCGGGTEAFTQNKEALKVTTPLVGTSLTDVWGRATTGGTTTLVHSADLKRWAQVSLAPEGSTVEPGVVSFIADVTGSLWITTGDEHTLTFQHLTSKGTLVDHTSELPLGLDTATLFGSGAALLMTGTVRSSPLQVTKVYRYRSGAFEEVTALATAIEFTVLATRSLDDFYVWESSLQVHRLMHVVGTVATQVTAWTAIDPPVMELGENGEAWAWAPSTSATGIHGDGTTFTQWSAISSWPKQTADSALTHLPLMMVAAGPNKLSMLVHTSNVAGKSNSEKDSMRVMHLDEKGSASLGVVLAKCNSPADCNGSAQRLSDGSIITTGSPDIEMPTWLSGPSSALK